MIPKQPLAVIEQLTFRVSPGGQRRFIEADSRIWGSALASFPGFLHKEVWLDPQDLELVILTIYWASESHWQAFPAEKIQQLDQQMSPYFVSMSCKQLTVESRLGSLSSDPLP